MADNIAALSQEDDEYVDDEDFYKNEETGENNTREEIEDQQPDDRHGGDDLDYSQTEPDEFVKTGNNSVCEGPRQILSSYFVA